MQLSTHGGKCCGIKVIHQLPARPEGYVNAVDADALIPSHTVDGYGLWDYRNPGKRFYPLSAPMETGGERLKRYLAYLDEVRPQGIAEITLTTDYYWATPTGWEPVLTPLGFKAVNSCKNSNSNKVVTVYHRNSGEVPSLAEKPEKKATPLRATEEVL
jgi:hypothetical protein